MGDGVSAGDRTGAWLRKAPPYLLAVAVVLSGFAILRLERGTTFLFDDWNFLLDRRGMSVGVFLDPHNEHIAILPVAIYKALIAIFGITSDRPLQVAGVLLFLASVVVLYAYLRRRVGDWLALFAAAIVLFLGSAWLDLIWSFQLAFSGSTAAGIGMLLALDRDDQTGDRVACGLLLVSLCFSSLGLAFAAAALADLALPRRRPRRERAYVPLVPLAFFAVWWLGWGHTAKSQVSFGNVEGTGSWVYDAAAQGIASIVGLSSVGVSDPNTLKGLDWGRALLGIALLFGTLRLIRLGRIPRGLWIALAAGAGFWVLAALNTNVFRTPGNVRYEYPSVVLVLLIAAEVLRGIRPRPLVISVIGVIAAASIISNGLLLRKASNDVMRLGSDLERGQLTGLDLARGSVPPSYLVTISLRPTRLGDYYDLIDAYGSPAYTRSELAQGSDLARSNADLTLAQVERIKLVAANGGPTRGLRCHRVRVAGEPLPPGRYLVRATGPVPAQLQLGRYSTELPVVLNALHPGVVAALRIPADRSTRPWRLGTSKGAALICR